MQAVTEIVTRYHSQWALLRGVYTIKFFKQIIEYNINELPAEHNVKRIARQVLTYN